MRHFGMAQQRSYGPEARSRLLRRKLARAAIRAWVTLKNKMAILPQLVRKDNKCQSLRPHHKDADRPCIAKECLEKTRNCRNQVGKWQSPHQRRISWHSSNIYASPQNSSSGCRCQRPGKKEKNRPMKSITVGGGVLFAWSAFDSSEGDSELMFIRAYYESKVGGQDSESFHLFYLDECPRQEISVFLLPSRR
ncbi:hypothetical protein RHMOL_Rhmol13G0273700 [Rhododendron molle]|uniref:Uncharacterized protein n=1 Tax=Rhododendron molle TaxID=49168 RepID=A0ACC0LCB3_RHOML|nr:hypothetical protein RHMOL_Rhmol13G0273700 [Rhododendron molle]